MGVAKIVLLDCRLGNLGPLAKSYDPILWRHITRDQYASEQRETWLILLGIDGLPKTHDWQYARTLEELRSSSSLVLRSTSIDIFAAR